MILLHMVRESMGNKGQRVMDIYIDREGIPIINRESGQIVKTVLVDVPFIANPRGVRYALEVPAAIASPNGPTGTPKIRLVMTAQQEKEWRDEGRQVFSIFGTAPIELSFFSKPTHEDRVGLGETVRGLEAMAGKAVSDPQDWLMEMIAVAQTNALLNELAAHNTFVDPMISIFHLRHIRHAHPAVRDKVKMVVDKWEQMRMALQGPAKRGRNGQHAWQELKQLLQQTLEEVKQIDQTMIDIHFSMHESTTWRKLFQVRKEVHYPAIDGLQREVHGIIQDMGISLAAYSVVLVFSGADKNKVQIQGLTGHENGPFLVAKIWVTEVDAILQKFVTNPSKPNLLLIRFERSHVPMTLRAILKQNDNDVAVAQDIKDVFKRFILEDLLCEGGALFVPKVMADGQVNQLTGTISACQGEPGGEYDIRHPQFPGRAHLPPDVLDAALMPILREMARDYLIAPAVTSDTETEDSVAYLKRSFATSLDAEVNNNTFNWEEITYGTNITQAVTDCLQPQFVRAITSAAREGLWVHQDLVDHAQDQQGSPMIPYEQLEKTRRGMTKVLGSHPFQGGPLANKTISALIQTKTITVVGVAGAGIILTLPEMNDLIAILREDDGTVARVGEEIQYDQIKVSQSVVHGVDVKSSNDYNNPN
jgi:hypothetical protein